MRLFIFGYRSSVSQETKILPFQPFDLRRSLISELLFLDESNLAVDAVLTNIKRWQAYTPEYLEKKVNENLPEYLQAELGEIAAKLSDRFSWSATEVLVSGSQLQFPGGSYELKFRSQAKKNGSLLGTLRVRQDFESLEHIPALLNAVGFFPRDLQLCLAESIDPLKVADTLREKNWKVGMQLPQLVEASYGAFSLRVECDVVSISGFQIEELFQSDGPSIFSAIFGMFRGPN